jgi:putative DNA primase/helicase
LYLPLRVLLPPTPVFFNAYGLPYPYEEVAPIPERWLKFQAEVFGGDEEAKHLLQEWMGYLLTADTSQQKILLMVGPPRSGKGTIGRVITKLLGVHNVAGTSMSDLCDPHGLQELADKPAANISDARMPRGKETSTAVERLLKTSGEDPQSINPKFKDRYTVTLPTRITIMTNELPKLIDASGALVSRFLVLRFRESFLDREDPQLDDNLESELPGILLWALDGRQFRATRVRKDFDPRSGRHGITNRIIHRRTLRCRSGRNGRSGDVLRSLG